MPGKHQFAHLHRQSWPRNIRASSSSKSTICFGEMNVIHCWHCFVEEECTNGFYLLYPPPGKFTTAKCQGHAWEIAMSLILVLALTAHWGGALLHFLTFSNSGKILLVLAFICAFIFFEFFWEMTLAFKKICIFVPVFPLVQPFRQVFFVIF